MYLGGWKTYFRDAVVMRAPEPCLFYGHAEEECLANSPCKRRTTAIPAFQGHPSQVKLPHNPSPVQIVRLSIGSLAMSRLPNELILHIIECLIPSGPAVAFPASHPITRTLVSFTLVCKATHSTAVRLLHLHCLHIDSEQRLVHLLASSQFYASSLINKWRNKTIDSSRVVISSLPSDTPMGLYISPFPDDSIDKPQIVKQVHNLFLDVSLRLRRLVIDMPLRSLYPEDDHSQVRPTLRAAFASLTALEEFCSVRDELFCATIEERTEPVVWASWPQLKRLALYNADVTSSFFLAGIRGCRALTHLVLTRADGLDENILDSECPPLAPLQRVMVVNTEMSHRQRPPFSPETWRKCFLGRIWAASQCCLSPASQIPESVNARLKLMDQLLVRIDVPVSAGPEVNEITICQEWVNNHATDGTLWQFAGLPISGNGDRPPL